ncbi:hypothetical protein KIN20_030518 [Parelaphostrongylus tenuis]|uniref:Uncharacterized protein n=1 Tax=Parelaphostrongylus tenuis TaxID=148309 RepID=A0AAD5R3V0_PARTN|nr:hypothetical protein KIN20_030518 [Parelaphostrongylus tenuis]
MQTVFDVLESQGRNALLPDAVIATILGQLSVKTSYKPLKCQMVTSPEEQRGSLIINKYSNDGTQKGYDKLRQ